MKGNPNIAVSTWFESVDISRESWRRGIGKEDVVETVALFEEVIQGEARDLPCQQRYRGDLSSILTANNMEAQVELKLS